MQDDAAKGNVALTSLPASALYRMQVREMREYAMFMIDPQGNLISWNAGVEHLLGYSEQEWIGQHASIILARQKKSWVELGSGSLPSE
jgi:PAS domain S-box-containing protein